jgi:hypothetical protein
VSPEAVTWEDYNVLRERYPHAPAWGQAGIAGGADVTPAGAMRAIAKDDLDSEGDEAEACRSEQGITVSESPIGPQV